MELMVLQVVARDGFPTTDPECATGAGAELGVGARPRTEPEDERCEVLVIAADREGRTVGLVVEGWQPFAMLQMAREDGGGEDWTGAALHRLAARLAGRYPAEVRVPTMHRRKRMFEFQPDFARRARRLDLWARVRFPSIRARRAARRRLQGAESAKTPGADCVRDICEGRVAPETQFLDELGVVPCGWIRVDLRGAGEPDARVTVCRREFRVGAEQIAALPGCDDIAPVAVASVDIECRTGVGGAFPSARRDPIICIGTAIARPGAAGYEARRSVIHCMRSCAPIGGVEVTDGFECEVRMLEAWRDEMVRSDVAVFTGYNILGFDYRYMVERHNHLVAAAHRAAAIEAGEEEAAEIEPGKDGWCRSTVCPSRFPDLSLLALEPAVARAKNLSSAAMGFNQLFELLPAGRVSLDLLLYMKTNYKLSRYTLDAVATKFVGDQKIEISHDDVHRFYDMGPAERARYCEYCVKDCALPLQICAKLCVIEDYIQSARVQTTQLTDLVSRGQQIRIFNMLLTEAHADGYVVDRDPNQRGRAPGGGAAPEAAGYVGATVLAPTPGFYREPVATLDFASLYPSIMRAHNLCYTTLWSAAAPPPDWLQTEVHAGHTFVVNPEFRGVLPRMLDRLLSERKATKRLMATEKDPVLRALLDKRQLAQKVSANSVYGFTGAIEKGMYPCKAVAETVTARGRDYIDRTRAMVIERFGHPVIYGDTDSVMVHLDMPEARAFARAAEIAGYITSQFPDAIVLEDEKVYCPYLLKGKKRYAGRKKETIGDTPSLDTKGIEMVRRDNAPIARDVQKRALTRLIMEADTAGAIEAIRAVLASVVRGEAPFEDYVITKAIAESYKTESLAHVQVAKKLAERGMPTPTGGRVEYVILRGPGRLFEKAEDAEHARRNGLALDRLYYAEKQIITPLANLFGGVLSLEPLFDAASSAIAAQYERRDRRRAVGGIPGVTMAPAPAREETRLDAEARAVVRAIECPGAAPPPAKRARAQGTLDMFLRPL